MAPNRMKTIPDTGRECAVSEVIGAVMLVSVVVLAVAIIGVALTSQGTPQKIPALDAIISNYGNTIQIYHNGGDTLQSDQMQILVDGIPTTFTKGENSLPWTSWSAGDSLVAKMDSTPTTVRIIFNGASGASTVLTSADFSPGGMINSGPVATDTLKAAFTGSPSSGAPPLVVQFTDQSTGYPVGWEWNFGDGTSTVKSPTHVYNSAGTYSVSLRVTNYTGSTDSTTRTISVSSFSPTVSGISPTQGVQGSSVPISVYGTNFVSGAGITLKKGSDTITVPSVVFVSATTLTGTVAIPSGATPGLWNVVVTNPDLQTGTLTNGFTVTGSLGAPGITSITPGTGVSGNTVTITDLAGANFMSGAQVKLNSSTLGSDIPAAGVTVVSANKITCTFYLTGAAAGNWNVVVTNPDGKTGILTNGFTIAGNGPVVTAVNPTSGYVGNINNPVSIGGSGFLSGAIVKLNRTGSPDILATGVTVASPNFITCTIPLPAGTAVGPWNVTVTNTDGQTGSLVGGFAVRKLVITASAGSHGTIDPSGAVSVNYGSSQSFTITPEIKYHIETLVIDGVTTTYPPKITSPYTFSNVLADHTIDVTFAKNQREQIFYDPFDVTPSNKGWTVSGIDWQTAAPVNGTRSIRFQGSNAAGPDEYIRRSISTSGYSEIEMQYRLQAQSLENGEYFAAQYSTDGGSSYTDLTRYNGVYAGTTTTFPIYTPATLPPSADDQSSNFWVQFGIWASATNDYGWVDDVTITGIPDYI